MHQDPKYKNCNTSKGLMGLKRFSIQTRKITLKSLVEAIVTEGGIPYGVSSDMGYVTITNNFIFDEVHIKDCTAEEALDLLYDYGILWQLDDNRIIHVWEKVITKEQRKQRQVEGTNQI
jgi:hypothetical protein